MSDDNQRTSTALRRFGPIALAALCAAGAAGLWLAGSNARSAADESRGLQHDLELVEMQTVVRRAMLADANVHMLRLLGEATDRDVAASRDERSELQAAVRERLTVLADVDDPRTAGRARMMLEALDMPELAPSDEPNLIALYDSTWKEFGGDGSDREPVERDLAVIDLLYADSVGALVLNDALDANYVLLAPEAPEYLADYVERSEPYIRSNGGYLGPDATTPLVDSYVYEPESDEPHPALDRMQGRIADSSLWAYDQWIRSWQAGDPGDAPLTLAELVVEAAAVDADNRATIDAELAEAVGRHADATADDERRALVLMSLAGLLALLAVGCIGLAVRDRWRQVRWAAEQAGRDPLTGVRNRYQLDQIAETVARASGERHLVAAVDMDRFKLVNDSLGHRAGDRMLIEVADRLTRIVDGHRAAGVGNTGAVIRMGGDEFVLALHGRAPFDVDAVRRDLDAIRADAIAIDGEQLPLRFSVGIVTGEGAVNFYDLLNAADLAAYDEKAHRADAARRTPDPVATS